MISPICRSTGRSAGRFPRSGPVEAARSRTEVILSLVRRDKPTLRQLLGHLAGARGHFMAAGTPEQIAELIEDWFTDGAADGSTSCRRCFRRSSTRSPPR